MTKFFLRFAGWWAAIGSLAAMGNVCPCCNSTVCPQGMALWGVLGAICACVMRFKHRQPETASADEEPRFARHDFAFERPPSASHIAPPSSMTAPSL